MKADTLIALEGVFAELGDLYSAARQFTPLRAAAESELLPALAALGSRLRHLLRSARLEDATLEETAAMIVELRTRWLDQLADVRQSADYRAAKDAVLNDDQGAISRIVPHVFSGLSVARGDAPLYFPVTITAGRRRPGMSPFLSAAECAERITAQISAGVAAEPRGDDWWEQDFPSMTAAADADAFDTPVTLRLPYPASKTVFEVENESLFRLFTPQLVGSFEVELAERVDDEWWDTNPQSYAEFREQLHHVLADRGLV